MNLDLGSKFYLHSSNIFFKNNLVFDKLNINYTQEFYKKQKIENKIMNTYFRYNNAILKSSAIDSQNKLIKSYTSYHVSPFKNFLKYRKITKLFFLKSMYNNTSDNVFNNFINIYSSNDNITISKKRFTKYTYTNFSTCKSYLNYYYLNYNTVNLKVKSSLYNIFRNKSGSLFIKNNLTTHNYKYKFNLYLRIVEYNFNKVYNYRKSLSYKSNDTTLTTLFNNYIPNKLHTSTPQTQPKRMSSLLNSDTSIFKSNLKFGINNLPFNQHPLFYSRSGLNFVILNMGLFFFCKSITGCTC
jgi:hypothetical protein